jgi:hypothetical protein
MENVKKKQQKKTANKKKEKKRANAKWAKPTTSHDVNVPKEVTREIV